MKEILLRFLGSRCVARWCLLHSRMDGLCGKHWVKDQDRMYAIYMLETRHGISDPDEHTIRVCLDRIRREEDGR